MKVLSLASALALALAGCVDTTPPDSQRPSPSPNRPPTATLHARHVPLYPGAARAVRIGFDPFGSDARAIVVARPRDQRVHVCPLRAIDEALDLDDCRRDLGNGVREPVTRSGMRALGIVLEGTRAAEIDLVLDYDEAGRSFDIRIPVLAPPPGNADCSDNACNPFFEVTPTRGGTLSARATWSGSAAALVLLQGSVLARAQTATGIPYAEAAGARGGSPLRLGARLSAPAEYALAFRHDAPPGAARALTDVRITATWPEREPR